MSTPIAAEPAGTLTAANDQLKTDDSAADLGNLDPITGEPGAHPVGVGVGAFSAGAAGAAIGSIGGPVGVLIGAAIGAVAGGLAGKEIAASETFSSATPMEGQAVQENASLEAQAGATASAPDAAADALPFSVATMPADGEEGVRTSAFHFFLERTRSGVAGDELGDWLRAERESRRE